jgi:hypothetical protein
MPRHAVLCVVLAMSVLGCATRTQRITTAAISGVLATSGGIALLYKASQPCASHDDFGIGCGLDKETFSLGGGLLLMSGLIALGVAVVHSQHDAGRAPSPR